MTALRTRRLSAMVAALAAVAALTACPASGPGGSAPTTGASGAADPEKALIEFVGGLQPTGPYRDPTGDERRQAGAAVRLLLGGPANLSTAGDALAELGFTVRRGADPVTGRAFAMFTQEPGSDRAWGMILVDLSGAARLAIEVPHPNSDLRTELVGLRLFRQHPAAILLVAGAHRRASDGRADVAHNPDSLFNVAATQFARRDVTQLQLHGFAEESLAGADVVVSSGNPRSSAPLRAVAEHLELAGFVTCRAWQRKCGRLEGTTNVQADEAETSRSTFIHLEMSWTVRGPEGRRDALADAVSAAGIGQPK